MVEKPLLAILDNSDQLLCVTRDYFDGNLHTFLQGTAAFFSCSVLQRTEMAQHFKVGNKISFVYDEIAYHFDITDMVKNENYVTIQADTLTLELRNEDSAEYKATKAMTFEEYLKVFLFAPDNPTIMGINEVSDKKLQLEWEGSESSVLARLFSLANKFDAEIEFVTQLNQHWGLDKIVLNVYKANDDTHQGIGKNRQDMLLEYGNNVETIEIHENIDNLKTAIKPIGTDDLTITDVVIDEKDSDGNRLFYSPKGDHVIRAVQARDQFRSKMGSDTEGYISKNWSYETDNQNTLAGQALAELKKLSKVELTVTIQAYEKLGIGDTVRAQNKAYQPTLNLSVRVSEQDIYFEEPEKNTTTFTNVEILKSEVDESLLSRVQALIKENKKYEYQLVTDNGTMFKNGQGQTTLTARVLDGAKDITTDVNLSWTKDGEFIGANKSVIVKTTDIHAKAVYRYDVLDGNGLSKGGYEVTIVNVDDGSDGADGKKGESTYLHVAWSNKEDHSDMVTIYPNPNILSTQDIPISSNDGSKYPITRTTMTEDGETFVRIKRYNQSTMSPTTFSLYNTINVDKSWIGKTIAVSVDVRASKEVTMSNMDCRVDTTTATSKTVHNPNRITPNKITTKWQRMYTVYNTLPQSSYIRFVPASGYTATNNTELADFYVDHKNWKVEELKIEQTQATSYCLYDEEVKFSYMGTYTDSILESSTNPEKYTWQNVVGPKGEDGADGKDGQQGKDGSDGQPGKDAQEVISGYLSNDSIIVPATATGTVTDYSKAFGDFLIYEGQTKISSGVTYSKVSETGMTSTIVSTGKYTISAITSDVGTANYQADYKGVTIKKMVTIVKNKQGEKGDATGVYESSSSPSSPYVGMLWRDSSLNPPILKKYNGSDWDIFMLYAENMSVDNLAAITANLGTVRNNYSYTDSSKNTLKGTIELNNSRIVNEGTVTSGGVVVRNYNTTIDPLYFDMSIYDKNTKDVLKQRVSISSTAIQLVDADLGITANLSAQDLLDTGWKNISSNGQCQYRKKFSTVYIRFDGWSWNKTGLIGTLPADCHPKKAMMFLVPCWSTSGTNDNFQLNADGRFERITNRSGTDAFCHLLTLGPV